MKIARDFYHVGWYHLRRRHLPQRKAEIDGLQAMHLNRLLDELRRFE